MRDQLQEVEAEEEASVVDSEVDFPVAAVASVVAEVASQEAVDMFQEAVDVVVAVEVEEEAVEPTWE